MSKTNKAKQHLDKVNEAISKHPALGTDTSIKEALVLELGIKTALGSDFLSYALANACLFDDKQQDYGPNNITQAGTYGCVVRMGDKFSRIYNLFQSKRRKPVNESIIDSFRDVGNYALIAWMFEDGKWVKY